MEEQDIILLKKFMEKIWPGYRNNVYRALYRTYHPSTYNEGFSNPMDNMVDATDEIDVAITKGENYGLIDKLTGYKFPDSPELYIDEGTNTHRHPWMVSTLLFNVLWDIVDEFRCYCGENGIDPDCKGKCMGEFPYLYEDYNSLHNYMEELQDLGAPLDILLDEYPLQLNKIQLSPDYPYRSHEHNHNPNRLEEVDKFLSRRLSVVRENIYTLSDGDLLGEGEQHKLEHQMCELFDLHKHEASEYLFNWSIKDVIKEHELTMNPSDNKRNELRNNLFDQLDDNFGVFPHPDGELDFEGEPVAIYSFEFDEFVPFDSLYDPLSNLLDRGVDQESIELFIEIITEWISYKMTEKPEMFNESKMSDIDLKKNKRLNEREEPGLSPELEIGDVIRVVDIDREVENIQYNRPSPELRPEKFTPYTVVDKESNGSESKHPFRYTLIPEDKLEEYERYEALHNNPLYQKKIGVKLLFPWVHQWIYADTPMANKVDRLTISENTQSAYDNEDLCDELTISTEEELREKLEGMSIGKEDRDEIEGLIEDMLYDTESLHPRLPSDEAETDFDISNMYGRKIQSILCTYEKKNTNNLDEIDIDFKGTTLGKKNDKFTDGRPPKERSNYTQGVNEELTNRSELNPELEKGDHVKIISIDGEHANMPKKWKEYVVNTVSKDTYKDQNYYGLYPIDQTDEQLTSSMLAGGGKPREFYLYRGDEWMKVKNSEVNPLIKKLNGMEVEIDTVKYDLGWVDEDTGEATGNQFFEISNPRLEPKMEQPEYVRNDLFRYDLIFREEESGILEKFFTREELERMFNQEGIKDKLNKAIYENYLKLYGMKQMYVRLGEVFVDDDTDKVLSENILDTFKVISELKVLN